jgi:hypothetical protein
MGSKIAGSVQIGMTRSDGSRSQHDRGEAYDVAATEFNWTLVQLRARFLFRLKGVRDREYVR